MSLTTRKAQTQLENLIAEWDGCRKCPLCERRSKLVHIRGTPPCNFLFVGEAPGRSEDAAGEPFVGKAGQLLNKWLLAVSARLESKSGWTRQQIRRKFTTCFINPVACMPEVWDEETKGPNGWVIEGGWRLREPTKEEVTACLPRAKELIQICNPRAIIYVGKVPLKLFYPHVVEETSHLHRLELVHPAYVLRRGGEHSDDSKRAILYLFDFVNSVFPTP